MKKLVFCFFLLIAFSCMEGEVSDIEENIIKIEYKGYYEVLMNEGYKETTFPIINIHTSVEKNSDNQDANVLQIIGTASGDDRFFEVKVYADSIGRNALFENVFDFKVPEGGTPYNYYDVNLNVLVNNDEEFIAEFSGKLKHYNQHVPEYIYLDMKSGSINFKY